MNIFSAHGSPLIAPARNPSPGYLPMPDIPDFLIFSALIRQNRT